MASRYGGGDANAGFRRSPARTFNRTGEKPFATGNGNATDRSSSSGGGSGGPGYRGDRRPERDRRSGGGGFSRGAKTGYQRGNGRTDDRRSGTGAYNRSGERYPGGSEARPDRRPAGGSSDRAGTGGYVNRDRSPAPRNPAARSQSIDRTRQSPPARGSRANPVPSAAKQWGSVARKGARVLSEPKDTGSASAAWRDAVVRARADDATPFTDDDEVWVREDDEERESTSTVLRPRRTVPQPVTTEIAEAAGARAGAKLAQRLAEAVHAYDRDRYQDALNILRPLARAVPTAPAVRELLGLTLYRMGRWRAALEELEQYRALSGSADQLPVMMDCMRALHRDLAVDELWEELRQASPSAEVVAEGRIVMAECLADRGDLPAAVRLLERDAAVKKPRFHHLREWYALADLYERAGDIPRARDLFRRLDAADSESFDARDRIRALR